MTANTPGEAADFPLLATGTNFHIPGKISGEGGLIANSLIDRGYPIWHFLADRAYLPHSKAFDLQGPLTDLGAKLVFDYDYDERGKTSFYEDVVQVGGQWYVHYMSPELVDLHAIYDRDRAQIRDVENYSLAEKERRHREIQDAKDLRDQRLEARDAYRLKPKGRHRPDGSRQYMHPDPSDYGGIAVDHTTGELIEPIREKTIVIPRAERALKNA